MKQNHKDESSSLSLSFFSEPHSTHNASHRAGALSPLLKCNTALHAPGVSALSANAATDPLHEESARPCRRGLAQSNLPCLSNARLCDAVVKGVLSFAIEEEGVGCYRPLPVLGKGRGDGGK